MTRMGPQDHVRLDGDGPVATQGCEPPSPAAHLPERGHLGVEVFQRGMVAHRHQQPRTGFRAREAAIAELEAQVAELVAGLVQPVTARIGRTGPGPRATSWRHVSPLVVTGAEAGSGDCVGTSTCGASDGPPAASSAATAERTGSRTAPPATATHHQDGGPSDGRDREDGDVRQDPERQGGLARNPHGCGDRHHGQLEGPHVARRGRDRGREVGTGSQERGLTDRRLDAHGLRGGGERKDRERPRGDGQDDGERHRLRVAHHGEADTQLREEMRGSAATVPGTYAPARRPGGGAPPCPRRWRPPAAP